MKKTSESRSGRTPFGQRLLRARQAKGLTQMQAATRLGISQSTLAKLERDATGSVYTVSIALLYGVNPAWLSLGSGPMTGAPLLPAWLAKLSAEQQIAMQYIAEELAGLHAAEQERALALMKHTLAAFKDIAAKTPTKKT